MGCLNSTPEEYGEYTYAHTEEKINLLTKLEANKERIKYKLLLLGAGSCGKSTLLRQIRLLHGRDFSESELMATKPYLTQNTIEAMRTLAIYSEILSDQGHDTKVNEENEEIRTRVARMSDKQRFTQQHCSDLTALWNDEHIHNLLHFRHTFQLLDTYQYLFDRMDLFWRDDYIPTFEDIIHSRQRTTWGINKIKFELSGNNGEVNEIYEIWDVGGERYQRKKWIHCFDNASAIIFVAALSGYNQTLMEDWYSDTNRMKEAIGLFRGVVNLDVFKDCHFIIFLNKYDLFREKVGKYSVKKYFKDYTGCDDNEVEIINFFKHKFLSQCKMKSGTRKPTIRFYIGSATDTMCCKEIFELAQAVISGNHTLSIQGIKYIVRTWYTYNTYKEINTFVSNSMTQIILSYFGLLNIK
eukprot:273973_1